MHLGEQDVLLGRAPRARHAGFGIDDQGRARDQQLLAGEGHRRQQDGCRVAAGIGDALGADQGIAAQLGQPVGAGQQLGVGMLHLVPLRVDGGIVEPQVGGEVHHADSARQRLGGQRRRARVWQA